MRAAAATDPAAKRCSTGAGGQGSGAGGEGATLPVPADHRADANACTGSPPPGNGFPEPGGECEVDADCTRGQNGRCIWPYGGNNVCRYDECFEDSDCGAAAVCACRIEEAFGLNSCHLGNCLIDDDCGGGGWCSPSAVHLNVSCTEGISPGSVGYFCHTAPHWGLTRQVAGFT